MCSVFVMGPFLLGEVEVTWWHWTLIKSPCNECDKTYRSKKKLTYHISYHSTTNNNLMMGSLIRGKREKSNTNTNAQTNTNTNTMKYISTNTQTNTNAVLRMGPLIRAREKSRSPSDTELISSLLAMGVTKHSNKHTNTNKNTMKDISKNTKYRDGQERSRGHSVTPSSSQATAAAAAAAAAATCSHLFSIPTLPPTFIHLVV